MTARKPKWSDDENRALITLYFAMLRLATTGQVYNKAAMIRAAQADSCPNLIPIRGALAARSKQSIEFKLMNATACHFEVYRQDYAPMQPQTMNTHGYRAMANYQKDLYDAMAAHIKRRHTVST